MWGKPSKGGSYIQNKSRLEQKGFEHLWREGPGQGSKKGFIQLSINSYVKLCFLSDDLRWKMILTAQIFSCHVPDFSTWEGIAKLIIKGSIYYTNSWDLPDNALYDQVLIISFYRFPKAERTEALIKIV